MDMSSSSVKTIVEDSDGEMYSDSTTARSRQLPTLAKTNGTKRKKTVHAKIKAEGNQLPQYTTSEILQQQQNAAVENEECGRGDETVLEVYPVRQPKKKKKKKTRREVGDMAMTSTGIPTELYDLAEDIVPADETSKSINDTVFTIPVMRSEPVSKLFIEKKNGFRVTNKDKIIEQRAEAFERRQAMAAAADNLAPKQNTTEFAMLTHRIFKVISVFLQGLFAGIVLWQIIASYMLLNHGSSVFLKYYYTLASPVQCLFYFLFAVSTVAVLDRYDLARPSRKLLVKSVTLQAGTIAVFFYFVGLVFSLATVFIDERIALYGVNPLLWDNSTQTESTNTYLFQWQILNLIRGITAILGWMIISFEPSTDRLTENLLRADENTLAPKTQTPRCD